mmetsp:Transcript_67029/g.158161  ORF Transcript_67029/g.158161 Transcript_67029/m.158161 type:complete len:137 (-) Transcript_67029:37-447(-)
MDRHRWRTPSCTTQAIDGTIRGALIGTLWGSVFGGYSAWQHGLKGQHLFREVRSSTISSAGSFAVFLGVYTGTHCVSERIRGVRDWQNATVAGATAGACVSLPEAIVRKNPRHMLITSMITAALTTTLDLLQVLGN